MSPCHLSDDVGLVSNRRKAPACGSKSIDASSLGRPPSGLSPRVLSDLRCTALCQQDTSSKDESADKGRGEAGDN